MAFIEHPVKNIKRNMLDTALNGEPLHLHISEVGPGQRSHPPHQHEGLEAVYMMAGQGVLEIEDERIPLKDNESVVFDPRRMHGLLNNSQAPMRYMVIIYKEV